MFFSRHKTVPCVYLHKCPCCVFEEVHSSFSDLLPLGCPETREGIIDAWDAHPLSLDNSR